MKRLYQSYKEALSLKEILEDEVSSLKDEVATTLAQYFQRAGRQATFFYLNIDLSKMDLFHMVHDGWLVDEE